MNQHFSSAIPSPDHLSSKSTAKSISVDKRENDCAIEKLLVSMAYLATKVQISELEPLKNCLLIF